MRDSYLLVILPRTIGICNVLLLIMFGADRCAGHCILNDARVKNISNLLHDSHLTWVLHIFAAYAPHVDGEYEQLM